MLTGFALSGGGAKGDFQLGSLGFLYRVRGVRPDLIVGTSVGAINGAKLAEGEGTSDAGFRLGIDGLEDIWLALDHDEDMWVQTAEFTALFGDQSGDKRGSIVGDLTLSGGLSDLPGFLRALGAAKPSIERLAAANHAYSLSPVAAMLMGSRQVKRFDAQQCRESAIGLYLCAVSMNSGAVRYFSKFGEAFDRDDLRSTIFSGVSLEQAVLASAAMPAFFEPQLINDEYYVDGGVREVIPVDACLKLGANRVFALGCGAPPAFIARSRLDVSSQNKELLADYVMRAIDLMGEEIVEADLDAARRGGTDLYVVRPDFEAHETTTIDPGLIRINSAYGWMLAFDVVDSRVRSPHRRQALRYLSTRIAHWRIDKRNLEIEASEQLTGFQDGIYQQSGVGATDEQTAGFLAPYSQRIRELCANMHLATARRELISGTSTCNPANASDAWEVPAPQSRLVQVYNTFWVNDPAVTPTAVLPEVRHLWHEPVGAGCGPLASTRQGQWGECIFVLPTRDGQALACMGRDDSGAWVRRSDAFTLDGQAAGPVMGGCVVQTAEGSSPGELYCLARVGSNNGAVLFCSRSADGGSTWSDPKELRPNAFSPFDGITADPALVITSDGVMHLFAIVGHDVVHLTRRADDADDFFVYIDQPYTTSHTHSPALPRNLTHVSAAEDTWTASIDVKDANFAVTRGTLHLALGQTSMGATSIVWLDETRDRGWESTGPIDGPAQSSEHCGLIQSSFGNWELVVCGGRDVRHSFRAPGESRWQGGAAFAESHAAGQGHLGLASTHFSKAWIVQTGYGLPGDYIALVQAENALGREVREYRFDTYARQWQSARRLPIAF